MISLYDLKGAIKAHQDTLLRELGAQCRGAPSLGGLGLEWRPHHRGDSDRAVIVGRGGAAYPDGQGNGRGRINGCSDGDSSSEGDVVTVCLLGPEDGKEDIVKAARRIARQVQEGRMELGRLTEEVVSASLDTNR